MSAVVLALVGCLLGLSVIEAGLRMLGAGLDRAGTGASGRRSSDGRLRLDVYAENPWGQLDVDLRDASVLTRYAAEGLADLDELASGTPFGVECRYDARGFRGPELSDKRPGVMRVLMLGDSFTEGQGVRVDATCPAALAHALEKTAPGRFEVGNRGRRGWDFPRLYRAFQGLMAEQPDIVVLGMVLNDVERTPEFNVRQSYINDWIVDRSAHANASRGFLYRHSRLARFIGQRLESWRVSRATNRWYRDMYGAQNARGWRRTQRQLREMNEEMQRRGGAFIVALWPLLVDLDGRYSFEEPSAAIERCCRREGVDFIDLRSALQGRRAESLWVTITDHHPNELAHRLAAEALAPRVITAAQSIQRPK